MPKALWRPEYARYITIPPALAQVMVLTPDEVEPFLAYRIEEQETRSGDPERIRTLAVQQGLANGDYGFYMLPVLDAGTADLYDLVMVVGETSTTEISDGADGESFEVEVANEWDQVLATAVLHVYTGLRIPDHVTGAISPRMVYWLREELRTAFELSPVRIQQSDGDNVVHLC